MSSRIRGERTQEAWVEFAGARAVAMIVDAALGWPEGLFVRIGHPVAWLGKLIDVLDKGCNRSSDPSALRRAAGVAVALFVIALSVAVACALQALLVPAWSRIVLVGILAWPLVAWRSRKSGAAIRPRSTRPALRERPSRASPRTPATASSRRCSGAPCLGCPEL